MQPIEQTQHALIDEFALFDNWMDKYQYIIELGKTLPAFPTEYQNDAHRIKGCQSGVWLKIDRLPNKSLHLHATSDSAIVSGLIAIILRIYDGHPAADILAHPPTFIEQLGLNQHLSPTRSNGLHALLERLFMQAQVLVD